MAVTAELRRRHAICKGRTRSGPDDQNLDIFRVNTENAADRKSVFTLGFTPLPDAETRLHSGSHEATRIHVIATCDHLVKFDREN
jgi:hypothetical protein